MTHLVQRSFKDKVTKKIHEKGSVYRNDDERRIQTLENAGYIVKKNKNESQVEKQNKELETPAKPAKTKKVQMNEKEND
jgi:hypothetical protein